MRAQRVRVHGISLGWQPVTRRAQQGSILGPALFNIFINNLNRGASLLKNTGGAVESVEGQEALYKDTPAEIREQHNHQPKEI